jgi:hypothetical protein
MKGPDKRSRHCRLQPLIGNSFRKEGGTMGNRLARSAALIGILFTTLSCHDASIVTAPVPGATPIARKDIGDGSCFSHEIVWDWSVGAWRDNTARPVRYYDLDPYADCPDASYGRSPDWGNDFGDGAGLLYWDYAAHISPDVFAVVERESNLCPVCAAGEIIERVAEDPEVEAEAEELSESAVGLAQRAVNALNEVGPRIRAQWHHIMTDKNTVAAPQWTNQFKQLLERVGMRLSDVSNKVLVQGHAGKHPQAYHEYIFERISQLINSGGTIQEVKDLLAEIANECVTEGTFCNEMITRGGS